MLEGVKMYNEKIDLTPGEILEHDFKIDARGYRPQEVDKYLDMIIRDYTEYNNIIKNLKGQINDLTSDNNNPACSFFDRKAFFPERHLISVMFLN